MSKFNLTTKTEPTLNRSGHIAYAMDAKSELAASILTTFFNEKKYYGATAAERNRLFFQVEPLFLAQLAVYARKEFHMRSVAHVLAAVVAYRPDAKKYTRAVIQGVVERPDDLTEILAYYITTFKKPIPNALKKAMAARLNQFSTFQLARYQSTDKTITLKDVICLTHPKPKDVELAALYRSIIEQTLPVPLTWETELSAHGNSPVVWAELIENEKIGYMALLRNLRNILSHLPKEQMDNESLFIHSPQKFSPKAGKNKVKLTENQDKHNAIRYSKYAKAVEKALTKIANREAVLSSKQLPFRFFSAYMALKKESYLSLPVKEALETAFEHSISNIERISGRTLIAIDTSGSMSIFVSANSEIRCVDIARVLAVIAERICDASTVVAFDTQLYYDIIPKNGGMIEKASQIENYGGGTDLTLPMQFLLQSDQTYDRIIMLSDNEINSRYQRTCQSYADQYRQKRNPDFWVHAIDLQGYGTQQFRGINTNIIAGWSEKTLEFINFCESGTDTLISRIEKLELNDECLEFRVES